MNPITHKELIKQVSYNIGMKQADVERVLNRYVDLIAVTLASGQGVTVRDLGTLQVLETPAKKGRNLNTNEEIDIPPSRRVKLRPCASLKQAVLKGIITTST